MSAASSPQCLHTSPSISAPRLSCPPVSPQDIFTTRSDPTHTPTTRKPQEHGRLVSLGSVWALFCGYGNINPLSIDYACRPRLRSRLTLGGLTCPRNP